MAGTSKARDGATTQRRREAAAGWRRAARGRRGGWLAANYPAHRTSARPAESTLRSNGARAGAAWRGVETGQALVETALVLPVLLLLAFGIVGAARVTQAQMGVSAVSREAARVAAFAASPADAVARATDRGRAVADGYRLTNGTLQLSVDPGTLARGGQVRAAARYELSFDDLPLLWWVRVPVRSSHAELIDPYRSR